MDFSAALRSSSVATPSNGVAATAVQLGEAGSELRLASPGKVILAARVAARLDEQPNPEIRARSYTQTPYWSIERARLGQSREVPVEVIVNGYPVAKRNVVADGVLRDLDFEVSVERSSWIALRILPSSHTNPIWVVVGNKPVRASRRSIEWCLKGVDQCWSQKSRFIAEAELPQARTDYDHARKVYRQRLNEAEVD